MAPIVAMISLLEYDDSTAEEKQEWFQEIYSQTRRLTNLATNISQLGRDKAGGFENLQFVQIISQTLRNLLSITYFSDYNIVEKFDFTNSVVHGSANEIKQLFLQILLNAVRAVKNDIIEVGIDNTRQNHVTLWVKDGGCGIPEKQQTRLLDPNSKGMGLKLVHHIAKRHNAKLSIESEIGVGTTVSVTFPKLHVY